MFLMCCIKLQIEMYILMMSIRFTYVSSLNGNVQNNHGYEVICASWTWIRASWVESPVTDWIPKHILFIYLFIIYLFIIRSFIYLFNCHVAATV